MIDSWFSMQKVRKKRFVEVLHFQNKLFSFLLACSSLIEKLYFYMLKMWYFYTEPLQENYYNYFHGGKVPPSIWKVMLKNMQRARVIQFTHLQWSFIFPISNILKCPVQVFHFIAMKYGICWINVKCDQICFSSPLIEIGQTNQIKCGQICFGSPMIGIGQTKPD